MWEMKRKFNFLGKVAGFVAGVAVPLYAQDGESYFDVGAYPVGDLDQRITGVDYTNIPNRVVIRESSRSVREVILDARRSARDLKDVRSATHYVIESEPRRKFDWGLYWKNGEEIVHEKVEVIGIRDEMVKIKDYKNALVVTFVNEGDTLSYKQRQAGREFIEKLLARPGMQRREIDYFMINDEGVYEGRKVSDLDELLEGM